MKTTAQILKEARELLSSESRWTQGVIARDVIGVPVGAESDEAVCYCSLGAIDKVAGYQDAYSGNCATRKLQQVLQGSVISFNDKQGRKHSEVLAAFDAAISLAEEEE